MAPLGYTGRKYGPVKEQCRSMPSILFVCSANICRSPMAAALFRKKLEHLPKSKKWRVESAGTWGLDGSDMADSVKTVLEEMGITAEEHSARTVDPALLDSFDLIVAMEKDQVEALRIEFPKISGRVYLLSEMIGERFDIQDPIGEPLEEFRKTAKVLSLIMDQGFDKILQLTRARK